MEIDNLLNTIYLTFAHNQYALAFFVGMIFSFLQLIYKPSRKSAFLLVAFASLLIGFEYEKHIMEPLMSQTLTSLGIEKGTSRSANILVKFFQILLPIGFYSIGWGIIFFVLFAKGLISRFFGQLQNTQNQD